MIKFSREPFHKNYFPFCTLEKRLRDIVQVVNQQKWRWAGHVARMNSNRWTKKITNSHPYNEKRSRKRPDTRWRDEIEKFAGIAWQRLAQDRQLWKELGKAFVQQWTYNGWWWWWWWWWWYICNYCILDLFIWLSKSYYDLPYVHPSICPSVCNGLHPYLMIKNPWNIYGYLFHLPRVFISNNF